RILTVGLGIGDVLREVGHDAEHRTARLNIAAPAEPGRLRTTFADVVSSPLPKRLTALVTDWIRFAPKAQGAQDGAGTTKSSRLDRRGRRRTSQPGGGAVRRPASGHHRVRKRGGCAGSVADGRA